MKDTITGALNIPDEWLEKVHEQLEIKVLEKEAVSDVILESALELKEEEFGEGDYTLTEYEKKLVLLGFMMQSSIMRVKTKNAMFSFLESIKNPK